MTSTRTQPQVAPTLAVVAEGIKVQAGHADFSGRWSERRDAAVNRVRREKRQKTEEPDRVFQSVQAGSWSRGRATMSRRKQSKPRQIKRKHV